MEEAKNYLQRNCLINVNGMAMIRLEKLITYSNLIQLETLLEYVQENSPTSTEVISTIKTEIKDILDGESSEEETKESNPLQY